MCYYSTFRGIFFNKMIQIRRSVKIIDDFLTLWTYNEPVVIVCYQYDVCGFADDIRENDIKTEPHHHFAKEKEKERSWKKLSSQVRTSRLIRLQLCAATTRL